MAPVGSTDWIGIWSDLWSYDGTAIAGLFAKNCEMESGLKNRIPPLPRMQGWGRSA
jgi:hypothetical protein